VFVLILMIYVAGLPWIKICFARVYTWQILQWQLQWWILFQQ